MFARRSETTMIMLVWIGAIALLGCGKAAAEREAFRKIREHGGKIELHGNGPEIIFSNVKISDDDLGCLKGLSRVHELTLEFVDITDKGLDHILSLDQLDRVGLRKTKITDEGINKLKQKFPDVVVDQK